MRDEEPPMPPPSPTPPSRLRRTLHTLRSPFRSGSPFHIGSLKRSGSGKSSASDGEIVRDERTMRKRNKKHRDAASEASRSTDSSPSVDKKKKDSAGGSLLRRMGSIGRKKPEGTRVPTPPPQTETAESSLEKAPTPPLAELEVVTPEPPVSPIAVEHPVATRPFTKAAWKRKSSEPEMEKPIEPVEEPSPDSALRRRIAFVAQASACLSEDHDDGEERGEQEVGSLEEAVALARVKLGVAARTPSPAHSRDDVDTEEEGYADAMPAYGDLIEPDSKPEPGSDGAAAAAAAPSHASPSAERREHLYKILVIGELGTGKTSIIKRYVHQFFSQHYRATIGVDFALKVLNWDANTIIRLQLWDIAGQERFGNMTRVYYKEAVGAFIVFDVSRVATFDAVVKWKNDLDTKVQLPDGSPIPCILLANKCDQQKEGLVNSPAKMDEYCREKGFAGWFETSAKENINIEEAARSLVNKILLNDKLLQSNDGKDAEKFALDHKIANGENSRDGGSKSCAC
ncbi:ras-related protein Rab-44 isoform X1 [Hyposmocoma kahamanoa]|uniref:ras-related protein Rab-44 isoform X1 n=1 Tax=Hyposmocoma kahamanoa TaxID=1477025 RepID=UPI000E6D9C1D|nr:ras-related protein Rab-44 isoform X1 [Hyposmocoma kahamanoa]